MQTQAICVKQTGGPEVLEWQTQQLNSPDVGEVLVKHLAIGINFIDIYFRQGVYPAQLPFIPGCEAAGVVEAVGEEVTEFKVGDRVAYCTAPLGAYSQTRLVPASTLIPLPDDIDFDLAAAMLLKGLTAEYLLRRTYHVHAGDTVLFHAAAGGVGTIACQWLKKLGATVIGTVGSTAKAEYAKQHGCDHTILYQEEDVVKRVREITDGKGVPVVYDSVGKATYEISLNCLAPRGYFVSYGNASGLVEPVPPMALASRGSLFFTRPRLFDYCAERSELLLAATALFDIYREGLKIEIDQQFALPDAHLAHQALESRQTKGSTILTV